MFIDKRMIYFILAIMVISGLVQYITDTNALLTLLLTIPGLLVAITFHEFAHAYAADKLGDDTPRMQGRLTLNPLGHLDPIGSIMLLFAGFGWGKPVEVNPRNYDRRFSMEKADAIVSIAGPLMNFFLAIVLTLIYCAIYKFAGTQVVNSQIGTIIMLMINIAISINIGLGVFNLIPVPPLDGSKVIKPLLSNNAKIWFENNERIFEMVFVVLWIVGILSAIISPIIHGIYSGVLSLGFKLFGITLIWFETFQNWFFY